MCHQFYNVLKGINSLDFPFTLINCAFCDYIGRLKPLLVDKNGFNVEYHDKEWLPHRGIAS